VPGGADHFPVGITEAEDLTVVERHVDGVRAYGLVEVFRGAAARVPAGDGVRLRGTGRDAGAARLQEGIATDVVGVPMGVHDQADVSGVGAGPGGGVLGVADESAVDQGRSASVEQQKADAAATALASLKRMAGLAPRVLLPSHGPIPADPVAAFVTALRRARRLVDPDGAIWYGARRISAFALMIRGGIATDEVEPYLHARAWLTDAARLLGLTPEALSAELIALMLRSGAVVLRDGRLHAAADHTPVEAETLRVPYPRVWPTPEPR
jgi:hypothetical protein